MHALYRHATPPPHDSSRATAMAWRAHRARVVAAIVGLALFVLVGVALPEIMFATLGRAEWSPVRLPAFVLALLAIPIGMEWIPRCFRCPHCHGAFVRGYPSWHRGEVAMGWAELLRGRCASCHVAVGGASR